MPAFVIDETKADRATLIIIPKKEGRDPLEFDLHNLTLHGASKNGAMSFQAALTNASLAERYRPREPSDLGKPKILARPRFLESTSSVEPIFLASRDSKGRFPLKALSRARWNISKLQERRIRRILRLLKAGTLFI